MITAAASTITLAVLTYYDRKIRSDDLADSVSCYNYDLNKYNHKLAKQITTDDGFVGARPKIDDYICHENPSSTILMNIMVSFGVGISTSMILDYLRCRKLIKH